MLVEFFLNLALFLPMILCSTDISYREEKKKIMAEYHKMNSEFQLQCSHFPIGDAILKRILEISD
jgi:hypothetical protein